jgi:hypothetical protein
MTTLTDTQVVTASGGLVELGYSQITSNVTIDNATAGTGKEVIAPLTVVCDGGPVLVEFFSPAVRASITANDDLWISLFYDGSERSRNWGFLKAASSQSNHTPMYLSYRMTPTAGSHTFSVRGTVTNASRPGTVSAASATSAESPAFLRVSKIVQATQWPAVTTGTIICTSTTRPAAPFEGQTIYETDSKKRLTYDGTGWYAFDQVIAKSSQITTSQNVASTSWTDLTNYSCSVTYGANRTLRASFQGNPYSLGGIQAVAYRIVRGSSPTVVRQFNITAEAMAAGISYAQSHSAVFTTSSAATETFKVQFAGLSSATQITNYCDSSQPGIIVVEDIGPA